VQKIWHSQHFKPETPDQQLERDKLEKIFNHIWSNKPIDNIIERIGSDIIQENQEIILLD
jgi:hypothetical protein